MLQKARRNRHPKIGVRVDTPTLDESPDGFGIAVDELTNRDDRLPARIQGPFGRRFSWENAVCSGNSLANVHTVSLANIARKLQAARRALASLLSKLTENALAESRSHYLFKTILASDSVTVNKAQAGRKPEPKP